MSKSADAFRTISEVAEWLDTPAHVLRFWESKFSQVKPVKRAGGRRYYRPQDMMLLGGIKKLLHDDGMTIKHVQKLLRQEGVKYVSAMSSNPSDGMGYAPADAPSAPEPDIETSRIVSFTTPPDPTEDAVTPDPTPAFAPEPVSQTPAEPIPGPMSEPEAEEPKTRSDMAPEAKSMPFDRAPVDANPNESDAFDSGPVDATPADPDPVTPPPAEETPAEGSLPFPSFLAGGRDMPQPEPSATAAPEPAAPEPAGLPPVEDAPEPVPHINVFAKMGGRSSDDFLAHGTALRPLMDRIRAQLERMS